MSLSLYFNIDNYLSKLTFKDKVIKLFLKIGSSLYNL